MKENPTAPAQAQHSPLPWTSDQYGDGLIWDNEGRLVANRVTKHPNDQRFIVRACNNAQRLADALTALAHAIPNGEHLADMVTELDQAEEALAEWSKHKNECFTTIRKRETTNSRVDR